MASESNSKTAGLATTDPARAKILGKAEKPRTQTLRHVPCSKELVELAGLANFGDLLKRKRANLHINLTPEPLLSSLLPLILGLRRVMQV